MLRDASPAPETPTIVPFGSSVILPKPPVEIWLEISNLVCPRPSSDKSDLKRWRLPSCCSTKARRRLLPKFLNPGHARVGGFENAGSAVGGRNPVAASQSNLRVSKIHPVDDRTVGKAGHQSPRRAAIRCACRRSVCTHKADARGNEINLSPGAAVWKVGDLLPSHAGIRRAPMVGTVSGSVADDETIIGITAIDVVERVGRRDTHIDVVPGAAAVRGLDQCFARRKRNRESMLPTLRPSNFAPPEADSAASTKRSHGCQRVHIVPPLHDLSALDGNDRDEPVVV